MKSRVAAFALSTLALAGCGGSSFAPRISSPIVGDASRATHEAKIQVTLKYGIATTGPNTKVKSFRINAYGSNAPGHVWDFAKQKECQYQAGCSTFIKGDPTAPFTVETYDGAGGTGKLLSTTIVYVNAGGPLAVWITLQSWILDVQVRLVGSPRFGVASRLPLAAVASGDGYLVGPAPYKYPVFLHVTGNMHLSTTKVLSSKEPLYLSYDGGFEWATLTASARTSSTNTAKSDPVTVRPALSISEQPTHIIPGQFVVARDGSVWVSDNAGRKGCYLAKLQSDLTVHKYQLSRYDGCVGTMTIGPDGRLWFSSDTRSQKGFVGFITSKGTIGVYKTPFGGVSGPATGSDGRLWVVERWFGQNVYAMTTSGVFTVAPFRIPDASFPAIITGPDGNLWIANRTDSGDGFHVINTSGKQIAFIKKNVGWPVLSTGKYLYAQIINPQNQEPVGIGKLDARRKLVAIYHPGCCGDQLTVDHSGALWFWVGDQTLGRISSDGAYCELAIPPSPETDDPPVKGPIAAPDGYLYYYRGTALGKTRIPE